MKEIKWLIIVLMMTFALQVSGRVVSSPLFKSNSIECLYVESVELTDSATRLNVSFVNFPGRNAMSDTLNLSGSDSGKRYRLLGVENYSFGTKVKMPKSGRYPFTLLYEPLESSDLSVELTGKEGAISGLDVSGKAQSKKYHTHITGTYPKNETMLMLMKSMPKPNISNVIWVKVTNGKFSADIYSDVIEAYKLTDEFGFWKGSWMIGTLFSDNEEIFIEFVEKNGEIDKAVVKAPSGSLTDSYVTERKRMVDAWNTDELHLRLDSLAKNKKHFVPEYYEIAERYESHPEERDSLSKRMRGLFDSGKCLSEAGRKAEEDLRNWQKSGKFESIISAAASLDNLAGLYMLQDEMWHAPEGTMIYDAYMKYYAGKFPGHPYSEYFEILGNTVDPKPGNRFNDFTVPGLDGKLYTLSEQIKGRPAVIDLWASWCSSCRRHSKALKPVYEEFSPKGFTIVGVAREWEDAELARKAVKKDGYPWLNLVDVGDANAIWAKYRCPNGGGKVVLVDPEGVIVAVNPSAEDVRAYLTEFYSTHE